MSSPLPSSIEHVADVEVLRGREAREDATPDLLIEVPHGADERRHYDALRARLVGALPDDLHAFFHVNTDVGAWAYGRATALALLEAAPARSALLVRSLIPRTFVDCNRRAEDRGGDLGTGKLTPGTPPYVRDAGDLALLGDLHKRYVDLARAAFEAVCGAGGVALVPHTYGPRTMGIDAIDDDIVKKLAWACEPGREETWPLRAEVDVLTRDARGTLLAPEGAEEALLAAFERAGFAAVANQTYYLHESSLGHHWSATYPGRVLTLEVRRDLLVEKWEPFEEMRPVPEKVERVARVLAPVLEDVLRKIEAAR